MAQPYAAPVNWFPSWRAGSNRAHVPSGRQYLLGIKIDQMHWLARPCEVCRAQAFGLNSTYNLTPSSGWSATSCVTAIRGMLDFDSESRENVMHLPQNMAFTIVAVTRSLDEFRSGRWLSFFEHQHGRFHEYLCQSPSWNLLSLHINLKKLAHLPYRYPATHSDVFEAIIDCNKSA